MATFRRLLLNTLVSGVTSTFLWFALTFWVFLETRSVVATGLIAAAFSISSAVLAPIAGTFVDRHRKHEAMVVATAASLVAFALATAVVLLVPSEHLVELTNPGFWALVITTLLGSVAGNLRGIALSTCVTLLVPEEDRDRANGMSGTVTGLSFAITSVFSGLVVGGLGIGAAYVIALGLTAVTLVDLRRIHVPEEQPVPGEGDATGHVDVRGALVAIRAVPGLMLLILLAAFNNLLGGVFMALVDPYGLSMVSVEAWGIIWGFISLALIGGGLVVAKRGLGRHPLRVIIVGNLVNWSVCSTFALQPSIVTLVIGMAVWLGMMPAIEAAEQTVLQRSIPFERQGRVFGFAQMVENASAPITAIFVGPIAEVCFMPFMTDGRGADWIGGWFGTGPERGIALIFTLAGILGVVVTALAWASRSYRRLAAEWEAGSAVAAVAPV